MATRVITHLRCPKCGATRTVPSADLLVEGPSERKIRQLPNCDSCEAKPRMAVAGTSIDRQTARR